MVACSHLKENASFNPNFYSERVTVIFCDRDGLDNLTYYRKNILNYRGNALFNTVSTESMKTIVWMVPVKEYAFVCVWTIVQADETLAVHFWRHR